MPPEVQPVTSHPWSAPLHIIPATHPSEHLLSIQRPMPRSFTRLRCVENSVGHPNDRYSCTQLPTHQDVWYEANDSCQGTSLVPLAPDVRLHLPMNQKLVTPAGNFPPIRTSAVKPMTDANSFIRLRCVKKSTNHSNDRNGPKHLYTSLWHFGY